jgi:GNAT superfamily N-acetyltransferase
MPASMPSSLALRQATLDDQAVIVEFNRRLARETEARELDLRLVGPGVARVLSDPHHGLYFVAERDGEIVGQLMITREWSDWRCGEFWWIQSVYVVAGHRRSGVFRALYQHVLGQARARGDICGLRLYVEEDNLPAQATYRAEGMDLTGYRVMEVDFRAAQKAR